MTEYIPRPVVDWIGTDAPDPRDAYTVRINGHVVGVHSQEESARNHAWTLEAYLKGGHDPIDWPTTASSSWDVAHLVEALEDIQKVAIRKSIHTDTQAGIALGCIAAICEITLAAHRKQGGEA